MTATVHSPSRNDDLVRAGAAYDLPAGVRDQLLAFMADPPRAGVMVLKNMPVGELPLTPETPTSQVDKDDHTETVLMAVANVLGEPVGYRPEHGGDVVQNIVPVKSSADRQVSTSSSVDLMFHTEAAFHPRRMHYLLLFALRGDASASTTYASVYEAMDLLDSQTLAVLTSPRFRCAVDESYLHGRQNVLGEPMAAITFDGDRPTMVFDQDLMVGMDPEAEEALAKLGDALQQVHDGVVLEQGDLLVVDNHLVVHGRTPFTPRFDGYDRWLQRAFVVDDLADSEGERDGRVIVSEFGV